MTMLEPEVRPISTAWPPKDYTRPLQPSFFTRVPEADKTVTWPPRNESDSRSSSACSAAEPSQLVMLRQDLPIRQEAAPVYQTQPVVAAVPRTHGGLTWPPENSQTDDQPPQRIQTPKLSRKNCPAGFQGRALPNNYSGYRVAPGVLHMSPDASRYIADAGTDF